MCIRDRGVIAEVRTPAGLAAEPGGPRGHIAVARGAVVVDLSLIHISEPTRLLSISYAVFCLKKKKTAVINQLNKANI